MIGMLQCANFPDKGYKEELELHYADIFGRWGGT